MIGKNQFVGNVSSLLSTSLQRLDLDSNLFKGTIPTEIGLLSNLVYLSMAKNQIQGAVPTEVGFLTKLCTFAQKRERASERMDCLFSKQIHSFCFLVYTACLRFHRNILSGWLPSELGLAQRLVELSLEDNLFSGAIPSEIGTMTDLGEWEILKRGAREDRIAHECSMQGS